MEAVMADVQEEVVVDETQSMDEFNAGFEDKPTQEVKAAPVEEAPAPEAAPIEYAQITVAQWNELLAKSTEIDAIKADTRKGIDRALGNYGELQRTLATLQSATPQGYTVDVTDDIVADIKAEFPELGDLTLKAFKQFASKLKGSAPAPVQPAIDPEQFAQQVSKAVQAQYIAAETEALLDDYPDWRAIVGGADDKDNAYRQWLVAQPAEYQARLVSTNSAAVISKSIATFQKATAKPAAPAAKPASTRQARIEAAVVPRGSGGSAPAPTGQDDFAAGFLSG